MKFGGCGFGLEAEVSCERNVRQLTNGSNLLFLLFQQYPDVYDLALGVDRATVPSLDRAIENAYAQREQSHHLGGGYSKARS